MVRLIASDLDGTLLLNGAREVPEEALDYIEKLNAYGVRFVAASGRQYPNLRRLFASVSDEMVYICEDGALVKYRDQVLYRKPLERKLGMKIIRDIEQRDGCEVLLSGENVSYLVPKEKSYVEHIEKVIGNRIAIVKDFEEVEEEFLKISIYKKDGVEMDADYFLEQWGMHAAVSVSGACWMDFVDKEVNKGMAMRKVQEYFGISKEDTMCFGDNYNDLEMFQTALYSYAMTSAHSEIRAKARYVATTVENILHDVYQVLSR